LNGKKRGARSGADVEEYWTQHPWANVGILTGDDSGTFVLDIDPDNGGFESYARMVEMFGELPITRRVQTGSGGWHDYYDCPPDFKITNSNKKLEDTIGLGLDIRGNGGMVVAPPSVSGKGAYLTIRDVPQVAASPWFLDLVRSAPLPPMPVGPPVSSEIASKYAKSALEGELRAVRNSTKGGQNNQLNESAFKLGTLVAVGALDHEMVRAELIRASIASGYPKRDGENSMMRTVDSGLNAGYLKPRTPWPPVSKTGTNYDPKLFNPDGSLTDQTVATIWAAFPDDTPHDIATRGWLLGDQASDRPPTPATTEEFDTWLTTFVRYDRPARLYQRMEWMNRGKLETHANALIREALAGDYPARLALRELTAACRKRGQTDPATPRNLLAAALGAALDVLAVTK
jgi:Bifunctional DNA primase/polymerase, N-terminal